MAHIGTVIAAWLFAKSVGVDQFGNKYYLSKNKNSEGKYKRFVIYNGITEPTKVPPLWHSWLHYLSEQVPEGEQKYDWQKAPIPNLTGTNLAYKPPGHIDKGAKRAKASSDYEPWNP
jgi:NADH:ubiquinone oxidoreductase subunit